MRRRVIVALGALAAGCGLSVVGTSAPPGDAAPPVANDAVADATEADDAAAEDDGALLPVPPPGETELPLEPVDAGVDADEPDATTPLPAFEIIAPSGGKFTVVTPGAPTPCSQGTNVQTSFRVENASGEAVNVRWYDFNCKEKNYGSVNAGNQKSQPTYVGHRWRLRSSVDGGIRGDFVLDAPGAGGGVYRVILR